MTSHPPTLTPYQRDVLDEPRALRATLAALRRQSLPADLLPKPGQMIVLTGMGASHSALYPLHQGLTRRGFHAQMVETSELLYSLDSLLRPENLIVAVSQSGASVEIKMLMGRGSERKSTGKAGPRMIGVTNTPGSPLAVAPDAAVLLDAGEEMTVSCKTYIATLAGLAWLERALAGEDPTHALDEMESAVQAMEAYLGAWRAHVEQLKTRLAGVVDLFYTGRGRSLAAAHTGGLITKESTHMHGEGMSTPAFRHGPLEMVNPRTFVVVCEGTGADAPLNRRLYEDALQAGGPAALISETSAEPVFRLPPGLPESTRPLFEILPVQMMTLALAELHGHEAGKFDRLVKVTAVE